MKFPQEYIIFQVASSYEAIEKAHQQLSLERKNLEDFLLSQDYVRDGNVFVHPKYVEKREDLKKIGGFLQFPSWAVVVLPIYS